MKKTIFLSLFLTIVTLGTLAQQPVFSGGGTGTENDPFVILTAADLVAIHDVTYNPNAYTYFRMDADVDLEGIQWEAFNTSAGFDKPIYFDGNGHIIKNLDTGGYNYASLFGILRGVCKNLGVVDARVGNISTAFVEGGADCATAGIIAGYIANNNYTTAISQGIIENCFTTGVVQASTVAGGIAGNIGRPGSGSGLPISYLRNCFSKANVTVTGTTGNARAGGIIGVCGAPQGVTPHPVQIEYCFATGKVTAGSTADRNGPGGIVGYSDLPMHGLVALNTAIVRPDDAYDQYGRIAAVVTNNSYTAYECWALEDVSITKKGVEKAVFNDTPPVADYGSYDGISKSAAFLADANNWESLGYDMNLTWKMGLNGYPILKWMDFADDEEEAVIPEGTAENPYKIYTAEDLNNVRADMNAHYLLMNDIDISTSYPNWTPLGKASQGNNSFTAFNGVFDGNGYTISGININYTGGYVGLFAVVGGYVKNLGLKGDVVNTSGTATGLLTGYLGQAEAFANTIENCYAEGSVKLTSSHASDGHAGLLVGNQTKTYTVIRNCYAKGSVSNTKAFTGGIAGRQMNLGAVLENCYAEVDLEGETLVGGIVGRIHGKNVRNCYATGKVAGVDNVGGVAGQVWENSPTTGLLAANEWVSASSGTANVGRVIGEIKPTGTTVTHLYGLSSTEVLRNAVTQSVTDDATGKDGATVVLNDLYDQEFYTDMGWDFDDVWAMPCNNSLPIFIYEEDECVGVSDPTKKMNANHKIVCQNGVLNVLGLKWNSQVNVYDMVGALVYSTHTTGGLQVNLPSKGIYMVEIRHEGNREITKVLNR